jgi:hypothetical protein
MPLATTHAVRPAGSIEEDEEGKAFVMQPALEPTGGLLTTELSRPNIL